MPNRLARESSPYLRQHAENPVDWYAWGDEALARAKAEDKPILLSVGYSACHWCHVMEHESFSSPEISAQMNAAFVCIKVDREERPDLDHVYQLVIQLMGRSGGWPLTVFLTPERRPFYAGTYFPPARRYGMPGFPEVLTAVHEAFTQRRGEVEASATDITDGITRALAPEPARSEVAPGFLDDVAKLILRRRDPDHGGFGGAPKFPSTMSVDVLFRAHARHATTGALAHARLTLDRMRDGGIWDQLGGGFHRYATDAHWLVPHFEKMLYDNALLLRSHVDAWRITGEPGYRETAEEIARYLAREMTSPDGALYATQDADSEGEEGRFFVWKPDELVALLGAEDARAFSALHGVTAEGNFEHGATVLSRVATVAQVAGELGKPEPEVRAALERARETLFDARERLFAGGTLKRIWMDGAAKIDAFLDDHAELACGALDVHEASGDPAALALARALVAQAVARFWDEDAGTFWFGPKDAADLVVRPRDPYDHAVPSGTSSIAHALLRLHALGGDDALLRMAERTLLGLAGDALRAPQGFGHLLGALDLYVHGPTEVCIVGDPGDAEALALRDRALATYVPGRVLRHVAPGAREDRPQRDGRATAYVCRGRTCGAPVHAPDALASALVGTPGPG